MRVRVCVRALRERERERESERESGLFWLEVGRSFEQPLNRTTNAVRVTPLVSDVRSEEKTTRYSSSEKKHLLAKEYWFSGLTSSIIIAPYDSIVSKALHA